MSLPAEAELAARLRTEWCEYRAPPLVPELPQYLVTERCPLWKASEREVEALGIPLPFWAFCWPGGQVLARLLLDAPEWVRGKRVLDFGSGGAVEGLAAVRAGAASVLCADIDPVANLAARMNAEALGLRLDTTERDLIGHDEGWEVVLAGDVFYDRDFSERVRRWFEALAARGAVVLIGDPSRGFLDTSRLEPLVRHPTCPDGDLSGTVLKEASVWRLR